MYWQANANTPLSVTPLLNVPDLTAVEAHTDLLRNGQDIGPKLA